VKVENGGFYHLTSQRNPLRGNVDKVVLLFDEQSYYLSFKGNSNDREL